MSVTTRETARNAPGARHMSYRRARADLTIRVLASSTLWLSLLLVTYWWEVDRGVQDLGGWATGLTSLGRLTGLVASVLLLAQVVLMARVPRLEAAYGQDRLAHLHRYVGFTSFNLMLAHIVLITWGYAAGQVSQTPTTLWQLITQYRGMLLATGGTVALVMVVVTSIRAARRRLRYESWHLLHLYAYLGVGLALPHQLWTGQQFLSSPGRTFFWWTAWAVAAGSVLVWRLGLPAVRNLRHQLRVSSVVRETDDIVSVHLTGRRLDRMNAEAGQFFTWRFLDGPGWTRAHPYSLSAAPDGRSLRITVQSVGDGSEAASWLQPGTRVLFEGPFGRLSPRARSRRGVALIGAGVGITPLRALAEGLRPPPGACVVLHRWTSEPLFLDEFATLGREYGINVLDLPGPRRRDGSWLPVGVDHRVDDLTALRHWVPDIAERDVYVCGPEVWTALVRDTLLRAGLPEDRLHLETFGW
ncbi:ferric reductase-like transmembrane domain-containing protein [Nocardioides cynanchi]|uniref:ferredoxin reductase family protein n=1 Tax=Nocardioides cynanchi TaxID=2558918 RepID=UPI001EE22D7F|nr:ferredoxin reductase family protein [Nocardioides cynanchi]